MKALFITADGMRDWREIDTAMPHIVFDIINMDVVWSPMLDPSKPVITHRREYQYCGNGHIDYDPFPIYREVI